MVRFHRPKEKTAEEYRNVTLFRTKFVNSSSKTQRYTFRTERQTKSSCSLSVQKGYTLGATTNLEFALPTNAAPGVSYTRINCHLLLARIFSSHCSRSHRGGGVVKDFPEGDANPQGGCQPIIYRIIPVLLYKGTTIKEDNWTVSGAHIQNFSIELMEGLIASANKASYYVPF